MPTTNRSTLSAPTTEAAAPQAAADVICRQSASGATSRSTLRALPALAAGQICRPSEAGTARASLALQDSEDAGKAVPAGHDAHAPEHAAEARPAALPNVPAGHSTHFCALRDEEKVPGEHGAQGSKPENEKLPGPQPASPDGVGAAEADALLEVEALDDGEALEDGEGSDEEDGEVVALPNTILASRCRAEAARPFRSATYPSAGTAAFPSTRKSGARLSVLSNEALKTVSVGPAKA